MFYCIPQMRRGILWIWLRSAAAAAGWREHIKNLCGSIYGVTDHTADLKSRDEGQKQFDFQGEQTGQEYYG